MDGGAQIAFGSVTGDISPQSFTASNITGSTIQIIVETLVSTTNETYLFDNVTVSGVPTGGTQYDLSVVNGSGDGLYVAGSVLNITADAAPSGQEFDIWTGDVASIADVNGASTSITMPSSDITVTATYRDIQTSGIVWLEDFEGLANGTKIDNGPTAWTSNRASGIFEVTNGAFRTNGASTFPGVWTSEVIPINGAVSISVDVDDADNSKEPADFVRAFYKLDGGAQIAFGSLTGDISPQSFTASNITGSTIQIIVETLVSTTNETYLFDNVTVSGEPTGGAAKEYIVHQDNISSANAGIAVGTLIDESLIRDAENTIGEIQLYPNPTDILALVLTSKLSSDIKEFYLIEVTGRILGKYDGAKMKLEENLYQLSVGNLEEGIYYVKIIMENATTHTKRLIIKKRFK